MMSSNNHDDDENGDKKETNRGLNEGTSGWSIPKDRFKAYIDCAFEEGRINEATRDRLYQCIDSSDDAKVVTWFLLQNNILYGDGEQSEEEDDGLVKKTSLSMFASMRNPAGLQNQVRTPTYCSLL